MCANREHPQTPRFGGTVAAWPRLRSALLACGLLVTILAIATAAPTASAATDYALTFNGSTQHGYSSSTQFADRTVVTIEAWTNLSAATCTGSTSCVIAGRDGDIVAVVRGGTYQFLAYWANSTNTNWIDTGIVARTGAWTHVALVRNGTALTFYVNGVSVKTGTLGANTVGGYSASSWPFRVGYFGYGVHYFPGSIDEVRYWSTARSASQIQTDMNTWGPANATGLVGYWDFNDGSGATAANRVTGASGTDLTLAGSPSWTDIKTTTTSGTRTVVSFPRSYLTSDGGWTAPTGVTSVDYLVVGGGGGGGAWVGGGGGGGGMLQGTKTVSTTANTVTVGTGGVGTRWTAYSPYTVAGGTSGLASAFADVVASGGGSGGQYNDALYPAQNGGSGGGAGYTSANGTGTGTGLTRQGFAGGIGTGAAPFPAGGGGGAGGVGGNAAGGVAGNGGAGRGSSITGTGTRYGGGGGGGLHSAGTGYAAGTGFDGGGSGGVESGTKAGNGTTGLGGGGGGAGRPNNLASEGGDGGNGTVILSYADPGPATLLTDAARDFNGTSDSIGIADQNALDLSSTLTYEAWVRPTSTGDFTLIRKQDSYTLSIRSGVLQYALNSASPASWAWVSTGLAIPTNSWTHIAFVKNGTALAVYLNGSATASWTGTGIAALLNTTYPLMIGTDNGFCTVQTPTCDAAPYWFYTGQMAEVRLWSTARTGAQIAANYNKRLASDLLSLELDEPSGVVAYNSARTGGSALNGIYNGTSTSATLPTLSSPTTIAVNESSTFSGYLPANDPTGDVTYAVGSQGTKGTVAITAATGAFTYTPTANSSGSDSFTYTVTKGSNTSAAQTIGVTVADTTAPTVASFSSTTAAGSYKAGDTINITATASEPVQSGNTLTATLNTTPARTVTLTAAAAGTSLTGTYTVQATDTAAALTVSSFAIGTVLDAAGNAMTSTTVPSGASNIAGAKTITVDTTTPTVTISPSPATIATGATSTVTFTISESVSDFTAADVSATYGTITGFTGSGTSYTATFTAGRTFSGTASIVVAGGGISDTAGNQSALTTQSITITATNGRTTFTGNGTIGLNGTVYVVERILSTGATSWTVPNAVTSLDYLVVAGGGGGGSRHAGGGGAGGLRSSVAATGGGAAAESALTVTPGTTITATVGTAGAGAPAGGAATAGGNSSLAGTGFTTVTSIGGGLGAGSSVNPTTGGSGGGSNYSALAPAAGTAGQGYIGGQGITELVSNHPEQWAGGGGGGAGGAGAAATETGSGATAYASPGNGGAGVLNTITGSSTCYAGGGGGGMSLTSSGTSSTGGACGGTVVGGGSTKGLAASAGTANTGSGGGGGGFDGGATNYAGGAGGTGVIILRYALPSVTTPVLAAASDTGASSSDGITKTTGLTITGSAPVGATVQLKDGGTDTGSSCAAADTTGAWSCTTGTLAAGAHSITAVASTTLSASTATSTSSALSVTVDTTAPTISSFSSSTADGSYGIGQTINITATASEAVQAGNTITVTLDTGATVVLTAASAGTTLTGTYTIVAAQNSSDLTVSSFAIGTVADTAGNSMTSTTVPTGTSNIAGAQAIVVDGTRPTVSSFTSAQSTPTNAASFTYTLTFSEAVTGVAAGDFSNTGTATGCTFAPGTDSGTTRTVTVSACSAGTVIPQFAASGALDGASNTGPTAAATATTTITRDVTAPTVSSFSSTTADGSYKAGATINVTATTSEAIQTGASLTVTLDTGATVALSYATSTTLTGTYTVAASQNSSDLTVSSYTIGTVLDTAGNSMTSTTVPSGASNIAGAKAIVIDTTVPTVSAFTSAQSTPTNASSFTYALTFSEAVTGVAAGDFSNTGTATGCVFAPGTDSGSTRTVTVTGCSGGTVTPQFAAAGANDAVGNSGPASAATATTTITRDITAPTVSSFTSAQTTPTGATSFTYTLTFSEAVSGLAASAFANTGTATSCSFSPSASSGTTFTITVSGCGTGTVTPRVAASAVTDTAGNTGPASIATASTTITVAATVTGTTTTSVRGGAWVALAGANIAGYQGTILVALSVSNSAQVRMTSVSGLTAATGYTLAANTGYTAVNFYGSQTDINNALATLQINIPSGTANVAINTSTYDSTVAYNATNGHYYKYVANAGVTWTNAKAGAEAATYLGKSGYLATITTASEDTFVQNNTTGTNIWIGHTDQTMEGRWQLYTSANMPTAESGATFWRAACVASNGLSTTCSDTASYSSSGTTVTYANWCSGEPNNSDGSSGEDMAVTKWNGGACWNDLRDGNSGGVNGYIVEFGNDTAFSDPSQASATTAITADATPPTVSSFSSSTAAGSYKAGDTVNVTATASEAIQSGNTLTVTLNTTPARTVTLTAASAGTTLSGTYTVQAGDTASALTVSSFSIGTVADTAGNAMSSTTVPTGASNIAGAKTIVIDTSAPTVSSFSSAVSSPTNASSIAYTLTFSETVTGVAAGDFSNTGTATGCSFAPGTDSGTSRTVTITGCSGGTVIPQFAAAGASDTAGNTGPATAATASTTITRDITAPTVAAFSTSTADGSYKAGATVNVTATTSEAIQSGNTLTVTLDTGATVVLTAASAGTTLTGTYTVATGQTSSALTVSSFTIGTVADTAGNAMTSTTVPTGTSNIAGAQAIVIDTTAPTVSSFTSVKASPTNAASFTYTLTFSEAVSGVAAGDFSNTGTATSCAFDPGADSGASRTVTVSSCSAGTVIPQFAAAGASDAAGNAGPATAATASTTITRDITAPTVTAFSSSTAAGSYKAGDTVNVTATTSEAIQTGNTITVTVNTSQTVTLTAASAGTTLSGTYTVQAGDTTSALTVSSFSIGTVADTAGNAMTSTTVPSGASNIAGAKTIEIDTAPPGASSLHALGASATNAATARFTVTFTAYITGLASSDFSNAGTATGCTFTPDSSSGMMVDLTASGCSEGTIQPVLAASAVLDAAGNAGPTSSLTSSDAVTRDITAPVVSSFTSAQSTPTNASSFTYTLAFSESVTGVAAGDFSNTGTATGCAFSPGTDTGSTRTVTITGCSDGTVLPRFAAVGAVDAATNTGPAAAAVAGTTITVDTAAPTVSSFSSSTAAGSYKAGDTVNVTATASEAIQSGNTLTVTLNTTPARTVTLTAASAGTTLSGTYTVQAGDTASALTVSSFSIGTVADTAGNAMSSTTVPTGASNIAGAKTIDIDTTAPGASSLHALGAAVTKAATARFTVVFSEYVTGLASGDFSNAGTATGCTFTPDSSSGMMNDLTASGCSEGTIQPILATGAVLDAAGNTGPAAAVTSSDAITRDTTAPAVSSFTSSQASPMLVAGSFTYTLTFSESVTGVAAGDFSNTGTATGCTFAPGTDSGTSRTVTVSNCADGTVTPQFAAAGASDTATNAGPTTAATATTTITINRAAPAVTSFRSPFADGTYAAGFTIDIIATTSQPVAAGGTITVTLDTGASVLLTAPADGTELDGSYTVQAGEDSADLTVASFAIGTAAGLDGKPMTSTAVPTGADNIAGTSAIVIDTTRPTIASISSSTADGSYKAGATVNVTATASEPVQNGSAISVTLDTGATVTLTAPATGTALTGTYTVAAGDTSADLTVTGIATIVVLDVAGNALSSTTVPSGASNIAGAKAIVIDTTAPTVSSFTSTQSSPTNATSIAYTLTFSESVTGVAAGDFSNTGTATGCVFAPGTDSGTSRTITITSCGEGTVIPQFAAAGASDAAGNAGPATAATATTTVTRDTTAPTVTAFSSSSANARYKIGAAISIAATTSEAIEAGNTLIATLDTGATVTLTAASAGTSLTGTYTVATGQSSGDLTVSSFSIGTVADAAGNAMTSTTVPTGTSNIAGAKAIIVDGIAPTVTSFTSSQSSPTNAANITFSIVFSESISGFSNADLVDMGTSGCSLRASLGAGTSLSVWADNCPAGTITPKIVAGAVSDAAGNTGPATDITSSATITRDLTAPTVTAFTSTTADGAYKAGTAVNVTATTSEPIRSGNTLTAVLDTGATVLLTAPTAGTTLSGTYTVSVGQDSQDLTVSSFSVGTVLDTAGNAMASTVVPGGASNLGGSSAIVIDTTVPTVASFNSSQATPTQSTGFTYTLTFSEPVTGVSSTDIVNSGTATGCSFAPGADAGAIRSVAVSGCSEGTVVPKVLAAGVDDAAGNAGPSADATATTTIVRDVTAPTITAFSSATPNGAYKASAGIAITATASEAIGAGDTLTVTLDTGATVVLTAASAGTALSGTYTVGAGDTSADLTVTSFAIGAIADPAGNAMTSTTVPSGASNIAGAKAIVIDTTAPTVTSFTSAQSSPTGAASFTYALAFSESVTGVSAADFSNTGTATGCAFDPGTDSGATRTVTVSGCVHGTVTPRFASHGGADAAGNTGPASEATSTITIVRNLVPTLATPAPISLVDTAANDSFATATGTLAGADADTGDVLSYAITGGADNGSTMSLAGTYGTLTVVKATGAYSFAPNRAVINARTADASESFALTVTDGTDSAGASLAIAVTGANDAPTLTSPTGPTYVDTTGNDVFAGDSGTLSGADRDAGAALTYGVAGGTDDGTTVTRVGAYGTLAVTKATGAYAYTPNRAAINARTADATDAFTVTVSDGTSMGSAPYSATIVGSPEAPVIAWASPTAIGYPTPLDATGQLNAAAADATTAAAVTGTYAYSIGGSPVTSGQVLDAGSYTLHVLFTPAGAGAGDYTTASANVPLTVNRATQTITVGATSTSPTYGQTVTLSASGYTGSGAVEYQRVAGPCSISGAIVSTTGVGTCDVTASISQDPNHSAATSSTLSIAIGQATLTVTAQNARKRIGLADPTLSAIITGYQNGDTASVLTAPVTVVRAAGEALGTYPITASGAAAANYAFAYVPATFTIVDRDVPVLTWSAPATIGYGTALSSSQLNAAAAFESAPVAGSFTYAIGATPIAAGTVLPAGSHVLTATFTPTDTLAYSTGETVQVPIEVTPRSLTVSGVTVADRDFDGTTAATARFGAATLAGIVGSDVVALDTSLASAAFDAPEPRVGRTVSITGLQLTGADVANYRLVQPTATASIRVALPGAPTGANATAANGAATVSWSAPVFTGGAPITGYVVTAEPGGASCAWTSGPLTCTITGLANGTSYTFVVRAANDAGTGAPSSPSTAVTPTAPTQSVAPDDAAVLPNGSATIAVGCAATARACSATVTMFLGAGAIVSTQEQIAAGETRSVALALPVKQQRRLAAEGVLKVRVQTVINIDGSSVTVETTVELVAPPAESLVRPRLTAASDGTLTLSGDCQGATVTRCEGTLTLFADSAPVERAAGRAAERVIVGTTTIAGAAGSSMHAHTKLTSAGERMMREHGSIRVAPELVFKGDTKLGGALPMFTMTRMSPAEWLRRALATLHVGGQTRMDLNNLLDQARRNVMPHALAAKRIETDIIPAREAARARVAALPTPPARLQPIVTLLLRAFDQSLAANHAYVAWLRSGRAEDTQGWRLSLRASATKARLLALMAREGARYGIRVPAPTNFWP